MTKIYDEPLHTIWPYLSTLRQRTNSVHYLALEASCVEKSKYYFGKYIGMCEIIKAVEDFTQINHFEDEDSGS